MDTEAAIWFLRAIGLVCQAFSPSYSACGRCWRPWSVVRGHVTSYGEQGGLGCFPLCEHCWRVLTPERRLPYYQELVRCWQRYDHGSPTDRDRDDPWSAIQTAVSRGE